ncbi:hypothetical protein [Rathayibacter agropyri]|uniref:hypothetical protein n=1 Tax=Rathayibacter agropyri TaxID=1634927 RepID=UPI001563E097|nr:hypothetical protein [Rathayibacter agropyri]NRD08754.1 hypothetical protein [Rathayibacter agropyri]
MAEADLPPGVVRVHVNDDRARTFGLPVLQSNHADARLLGYSIYGRDGIDLTVQAGHVLLDGTAPTPFTTRSTQSGEDDEREWSFHALDHIQNSAKEGATAGRAELIEMLRSAPRKSGIIRVDRHRIPSEEFTILNSVFARVQLVDNALITIAAPPTIVSAPFSTLTT